MPERWHDMLSEDPGVGFSIVDAAGVVLFANGKSADLFLKTRPEEAVGKSIFELFGAEWARERMAVLERVRETGRPVILRHIRHGRQIQSTIRLVEESDGEGEGAEAAEPVFAVLTVEGEHEPETPGEFEIVESKIVHLGPLDPLTRREIEVLALIGHGMNTPEIARTLHRSPRTIERHCDSLREKLRSTNRVQLAEFARRAGLRVEDAGLKRN